MSFSQLVSELGPPPEKVKSKKKKKKKKKGFQILGPPLANSWTRACEYYLFIYILVTIIDIRIRIYMYVHIYPHNFDQPFGRKVVPENNLKI